MSTAIVSETEPKLRGGTLAKQRAEEALREANIEPGKAIVADKKEIGKFGVHLVDGLQTNIHRLDALQKMKIYRFEVEVFGVTRDSREIPLTTPIGSDYRTSERRTICLGMYRLFLQQQQQVTTGNYYYYDLQRLLYAIKDLQFPKEGKKFEFNVQQFSTVVNTSDMDVFQRYKIHVKPFPEGSQQITLADFSNLNKDLEGVDRTVEQFLDIATSQVVLNNEEEFMHFKTSQFYFMNPSAYGFAQADCPFFSSNCSFLGIGLHKGIRPITTPDGTVTHGMIVQCKKSPFHENQDARVSHKAIAIMAEEYHGATTEIIKDRVEPLIKGIWVETIHRHQKFEIAGLAISDSTTEIIEHEGTSETVMRYFERRYNIHLEYPNLPLIIRKQGNNVSKYPMELCRVFDNQRVKQKQQTPASVQQMFRQTAISPAKVIQENKQVRPSLGLDGPNELIDAAGIKFNPTPIEVKARVLPHPELKLSRSTEKPRLDATWQSSGQYLIPAKCNKWMAVLIPGANVKNRITQNQFGNFVNQYCLRITQMGMNFAPPEIRFPNPATFVMKDFMNELLQVGYEFVLIAHPDNADAIHHEMKFFEQKSEVITQGLKIPTILNVLEMRQTHTMENIVHKTNVKMGGVNYVPVQQSMPLSECALFFGKETLFIGFATNHPGGGFDPMKTDSDTALISGAGQTGTGHDSGNGANGNGTNHTNGNGANYTNGNGVNGANGQANGDQGNGNGPQYNVNAPSVVGFSANIGKKHCFEFVGDYVYQYARRDEKVDVIADTVKRCVKQFYEREHQFPKQIMVLRNGCAEGAFPNILKYEVPLMKKGLREVGCQAKVTVMVINKLQQVRLFPKHINPHAKDSDQNIQPGTVVDSGIVHPILTEFYLNSHRTIQGTAAVPRYNCLLDENNLSMDALQLVMHYLCFGHQIVYSPTSLPSPVFIADEYAKRGRNNYNVWANKNELAGVTNHQDLTRFLSMENSRFLKYMRPNA